jgi:PleD family two-component response regulator
MSKTMMETMNELAKDSKSNPVPEKRRTVMATSKILIVDDDPDLRQALKLRLRANHYDTVHAVDGYSAITQAHKEGPMASSCSNGCRMTTASATFR